MTLSKITYGWRTWLIVVGSLFALLGYALLADLSTLDIDTTASIWFAAWVPAGIAAVAFGITGRPPQGRWYMVVPSFLAAGAVGRAVLLLFEGIWIAPIVYVILAAAIGPAWNKAVPTSEVLPRHDRREQDA